jgi:hypothetical protein
MSPPDGELVLVVLEPRMQGTSDSNKPRRLRKMRYPYLPSLRWVKYSRNPLGYDL